MEAVQATEQQKVKALEDRNFLPDFNAETKLLENKAKAEQELAEVNAQEAKQPTVIPANESVTGEEIVITPELKAAEQATPAPRPDIVELTKALSEARSDITLYEDWIKQTSQKLEKLRQVRGNEDRIAREEKKLAHYQQQLSELPQKINELEQAIANYNAEISSPNTQLTEDEKLLAKLRTPAATIRDFAIFFSKNLTTDATDIELGLYTKTQNGEENPAYVMGKNVGYMIKAGTIVTEEQYSKEPLNKGKIRFSLPEYQISTLKA